MEGLSFRETEIQRLFGHEAAEDEDPKRLREYYFKSSTFEQVATPLPLRILVGHKGIGKSALFKVAMEEDNDCKRLPVLIKPDDIASLATPPTGFLQLIRHWKEGLEDIIARKTLKSLGSDAEGTAGRLRQFGGRILDFIHQTLKDRAEVNLEPARRALVDGFLNAREVTVYIDDLDRGWQGRREDVTGISALLNAVRDISNENRGIRFKISLRSDVYYLVRTSDESTDKIEGSVIWQTWTNHEIFVLLVKRIETFLGRRVNEAELLTQDQRQLSKYLDPVMEGQFRGQGKWQDAPMYRVLMSLIRKRPRDLVKLCTLAARRAQEGGARRILTEHFQSVFEEYSQGRIQDTINEFRSELPEIGRLIMNMKPSRKERTAREGYVYRTDALTSKIKDICQLGGFRFQNGGVATPKDLAAFLYKINFLTARKETDAGIVRKHFEENRYLCSQGAEFGFDWEVHPAYRWALQPESLEDIWRTLELSAE